MKNSALGVMVMADDRGLWPILGKPMLGYLLDAVPSCEPEGVAVVGNYGGELREYLKSFPSVAAFEPESADCAEWRKNFQRILTLDCGQPFLDAETLRSFIDGHAASEWEQAFPGGAEAVRSQADLAAANSEMRGGIVLKWMEKGVRVVDPDAVWIGPDVVLEAGAALMPGAQLWGNTFVGAGSVVGPYCILQNAVLGRGVQLIANVIVEDSELKDHAKAGPFAYIRERSVLRERAFAGKFVEIKKTSVGCGSKVPHLSYMGDAVLGENVNIGAGSVTCNYDGKDKFQTVIGDRCFIGSDTMMVAPVSLGDDSATGAGSTITEDVPSGALALGRARQVNLEGRALKKNNRSS